jgi:hypothetical protein
VVASLNAMKPGIPLFLLGLVSGGACTLALIPAGKSSGPEALVSKETSVNGNSPDSANSLAERDPRSRAQSREPIRKTRASAQIDLKNILTWFSNFDDEAQMDPMFLIRQASQLTMLNQREAVDLLKLLVQPDPDDPEGNFEESRQAVTAILFARLCELNGPEAMRLVANDPAFEDFQEEFLAMGMNSWVAANPEGARSWFEGLVGEGEAMMLKSPAGDFEPTGLLKLLDEHQELGQAYIYSMTKTSPEVLEKWIEGIKSEEIRDSMREELMSAFVQGESESNGLIDLLNKSTDYNSVRISAIEKLTKINLTQAKEWLEKQPAGSTRDYEISTVANELIKKDSKAGIEWYMKQELQAPDQIANRLTTITNELSNEDPDIAAEWIQKQPDNAIRDKAEIAMANVTASHDNWSQSMSWIAGVENEEAQLDALDDILGTGWDRETKQLRPEVLAAAKAAGFEERAAAFRPGGRDWGYDR